MAANLDLAIGHARTVALLHPTSIRRAPIGMYFIYEDRRIRLRVSDQAGLDDYGVWAPAVATIGRRCFCGPPTWRNPSGRRDFFRAPGSRICTLWQRAGAGSYWIGARRTGTPARHEGLWRAENDGAQQTADHTPPSAM